MPAEMIKRRLLLGDGHWPFFALFPFASLLGVKRKRNGEREREREMEQNQSHLFVLRDDTLKRVAFLTIFLVGAWTLKREAPGQRFLTRHS